MGALVELLERKGILTKQEVLAIPPEKPRRRPQPVPLLRLKSLTAYLGAKGIGQWLRATARADETPSGARFGLRSARLL